MSHIVDSTFPDSDTYSALKKMAKARLSGNSIKNDLSETSLVHDAILRIKNRDDIRGTDQIKCFFTMMSYAMRSVIVDRARKEQKKEKVLAELATVQNAILIENQWTANSFLKLNEVLTKLAEQDPLTSQVIHLRFFLGLKLEQIAEQIGMSARSVQRIWTYGKSWLQMEIQNEQHGKQ